MGIASFSNGNLTSSRFFEILNRDEFLRLSLRIFGTPVIGCTFVNGVCGGCGELKLEPEALRVWPLADESPWCWDKGERIVDFTAPALLLKGAANDEVLLAEDSLPLVCKRHANGQRERERSVVFYLIWSSWLSVCFIFRFCFDDSGRLKRKNSSVTMIHSFRTQRHVPFWSCLSLSLCLYPLTQRMTTTTTAFVGDEWVRLRIASARQVQEKRRLFKSNLMRIQSQFDTNATPIVWSAVYVLLLSVPCFLWATVAEADHAWTIKLIRSNGDDISNTIGKERNQTIGLEEKYLVHSNIRSIFCPAKMTVNNNKKKQQQWERKEFVSAP